MVYGRINKIKISFISLLAAVLIFIAVCVKTPVQTNLLEAILPADIVNKTNIAKLADKTSSVIKVVFEADSEEKLSEIKNNFLSHTDKDFFEVITPDYSLLTNFYKNAPVNFLSYETRKALKNKNYDEIYQKALTELYSPISFQLTDFEKDPYFLQTDFIKSLKINSAPKENNDKFYSAETLVIRNKSGLSPTKTKQEIKKLVELQKKLTTNSEKIYLAGTPIHSYYTSKNSALAINIISILATVFIIFLTYFYFKNLKTIIPIALSIVFGFLSGFCAVKLLFNNFNVITIVFATVLIGIGIDYSYHYLFSEKHDKNFVKKLTISMLTTVCAFVFLFWTQIEILKQISVFIIFGLIAIYAFVLCIYPQINFSENKREFDFNFSEKHKKLILVTTLVIAIFGLCKINFDDSLSAFYTPPKNLKNAEKLYNQISETPTVSPKFITVTADNQENLLREEEKITDLLSQNGIPFISISKFIPSESRQQENISLVKTLYKNNLDKFGDLLETKQINSLKNCKYRPESLDITQIPFLKDFLLNENESVIFAYQTPKNIKFTDFQSDVSAYLTKYRKSLINIMPIAFAFIFIMLSLFFGMKKSFRMISVPILSIAITVSLLGLFGVKINMFGIIALYLLLGFTLDYSVFSSENTKKTKNAVFAAFLTTSFSFLLLSFTTFKFISHIALILFLGILFSYIFNLILMPNNNEKNGTENSTEKNQEQWFKIKEKSAGKKRLLITLWFYKIFGIKAVQIIAFFVGLITFLCDKNLRKHSKQYFSTLYNYTNDKRYKPTNLNALKNVLSYSDSLADKIDVFAGNFNPENIIFADKNTENELFENLKNKKGVFFICNHVGNIDVMRAFLKKNQHETSPEVIVFLQKNQCTIFNDFIEKLHDNNQKLTVCPVENIDITIAFEVDEKLRNGAIVYMAGDRMSAENTSKTYDVTLLNKTVKFPKGVYKFANALNADIYFVSAVKEKNRYKIYTEKYIAENEPMYIACAKFVEKMILLKPFQLYQFYSFFDN